MEAHPHARLAPEVGRDLADHLDLDLPPLVLIHCHHILLMSAFVTGGVPGRVGEDLGGAARCDGGTWTNAIASLIRYEASSPMIFERCSGCATPTSARSQASRPTWRLSL